jgi:hypothetical protein
MLGTMSYVLYPSMYGETSSTSLPGHTFRPVKTFPE